MIEFFLRRKVTTLVIFFLLILFGYVGLTKLKMELLPDVSFPSLTIVTVYSNVAPAEIESLVTKPIEEILSSVGGVDRILSESIEGISIVTVRFRWGTEIDQALIQVREKLDLVKGSLPQDVKKSIVIRFDPNSAPIMQIAVKAVGIDLKEVRLFLRKNVIPYFERVDGVAAISLSGGYERQIQVNVDKGRLEAHNLKIQDLVNQIDSSNFGFPAGNVREGDKEILVRTDGLFPSVSAIEDTVVGVTKGGVPIYLGTVGEIKDTFKERTSVSGLMDEECISMILKKESGKNTVAVAGDLRDLIAQLNEKFGDKLQFQIISDQSILIEDSIASVAWAGILAVVICYMVLSFFLGNVKEPIVVISAVPISVMATFLMMFAFGLTINTMSLGGLAIGVGMVVDSATVVLEAISEKKKRISDPILASIEGTKEVFGSILGSTITSVVVFLPIIFVEGIAAEIFGEFALTISFSLISSLFTSATLVPVLAQYKFFSSGLGKFPDFIEIPREKILTQIRSSFSSVAVFFIKRRMFAIYVGLASVFAAFVFFLAVPKEMLTEIDQGEFYIDVVAPEGSNLDFTRKIVNDITKKLSEDKTVETAFSRVGFEEKDIILNPKGDFGLNRATVFVKLVDKRKAEDFLLDFSKILSEIEKNYGSKIATRMASSVLGGIFGSGGGGVSVEISGQDLTLIRKIASEVENELTSTNEAISVTSTAREETPQLKVVLDREKMAYFGLTVEDIATTLKTSIKGDIATRFRENDFEYDVLVRFRPTDRIGFDSLHGIPIRLPSGKNIFLDAVADVSPARSLRKIMRLEGKRIAIVSAVPKESAEVLERKISEIIAKFEKDKDISVLPGEMAKETNKSFEALTWAGIFALILVYMTLASQFENLILPLIVMVSIVMVGSGSLIFLIMSGNTLNIVSGMGMVMLSGLVVNNAIILIEFFAMADLRKSVEEIVYSTIYRRIDTILNTTLTTVLGLLPAALAIGGESPQEPMALAVLGGLTASTIFTVVIIPAAYFSVAKPKTK
ncbi:efflux RND transporter permease subunit [Leptospira ellisii]|uniref:Efflux RND transporter permease subunit n=3 Tax=Leptospira ellisii TaxID=2023197 RepID=A0A2N0BB42_9LEPT|nr:efflux RND transporter permease subunit [Leptospira ellisii]MDV6234457.1 efflux RND transporter permease subunit [Leptospira ellisii]PJZ93762.1 heavy metal RND transporter permease [Leptospira ellisii]